jgi:hypothetical protein
MQPAPRVVLTAAEIAQCRVWAAERDAVNRRLGTFRQRGPRASEIGLLTECAVHKWAERPFRPRAQGPELCGDLDGVEWLEVKGAEAGRRFLVQEEIPEAKYLVLRRRAFLFVTWNEPVATLEGWARGTELLIPRRLADHFHSKRPCWAMHRDLLRHADILKPHLIPARPLNLTQEYVR